MHDDATRNIKLAFLSYYYSNKKITEKGNSVTERALTDKNEMKYVKNE